MSEAIRKPWILDYLIQYAETHGADRSHTMLKKGKVQIVGFRTWPSNEDQWLWLDISDKEHFIPARLTIDAVKSYNLQNIGYPLLARKWGLANIQCTKPMFLRVPREDGRGQEESETIVLEINQINVVGSEGESQFGRPQDIRRDDRIRRWIEGLKDPNGGGNELKSERIERTGQKDPRPPAAVLQHSSTIMNMPLIRTGVSSKINRPMDMQRKRKQWLKQMEESGLTAACNDYQPSQEQLQELKNITVFGLDSPTRDCTPNNDAHKEIHYSPQEIQVPTTPSQWSVSQRTENDQEDSTASLLEEPSKTDSDVSRSGTDSSKKGGSQRPSIGPGNEIPQSQDNLKNQLLDVQKEDQSQIPTSFLPLQKVMTIQNGGGQVLVPDSDLSGSHSQSQSVTQPSTTGQSVLAPSFLQLTQLSYSIKNSHGNSRKGQPSRVDSNVHTNGMESDKESMKEDLSQTGISVEETAQPHPNRADAIPDKSSSRSRVTNYSPKFRQLSDVFTSPTKRKISDITLEQSSKRSKRSKNMGIMRTMHDPDILKKPSSHKSTQIDSPQKVELVGVSTESNQLPLLYPTAVQTWTGNSSVQVKLSGWSPQLDLPTGKGIMTWNDFHEMLYKVGQVRKHDRN